MALRQQGLRPEGFELTPAAIRTARIKKHPTGRKEIQTVLARRRFLSDDPPSTI